MLFTGQGLVRMVKNRDLSLEILPLAYGLGQYFQDICHSFSPYGPPSWQITCLFPEIEYQISFYLEDKLVYYHYGGFI